MESTDKEGYFKGKLKIIVTIYRAEAWRPHNVELVLEIVATVVHKCPRYTRAVMADDQDKI